MARFHISPQTGEPGRCSARKACPFGGLDTDHYDSKKDARQAYEQHMESGTLPAIMTNDTSLSGLAKNSDNLSEMRIVLAYGETHQKLLLIDNPNATSDILKEVWKAGVDSHPSVKYRIGAHPNCPVSLMDKEMVGVLARDHRRTDKPVAKILASDDADDNIAKIAADLCLDARDLISNKNNNVSQKALQDLAFSNGSNLVSVISSSRVDMDTLLADKRISNKNLNDFTQLNPGPELRKFMYNHVNSDQSLKAYLEKTRPDEFPKT